MSQSNKIKAIIFDLNDVVVVDSHWEAITNAAARRGEDRNDFHYRIHSKDNIRNIITNFSKEWMRLFRSSEEAEEIIKLFDEVINSEEIGLKKPDKRIYQIILKG